MEYMLKIIVRQDKARRVILDILDQPSSLTTQDWVIFIFPSEIQWGWISEYNKCWLCRRLHRERLLEETSSQAIIQGDFGRKKRVVMILLNKDRPQSCQTRLLGSTKHKNGILRRNSTLFKSCIQHLQQGTYDTDMRGIKTTLSNLKWKCSSVCNKYSYSSQGNRQN